MVSKNWSPIFLPFQSCRTFCQYSQVSNNRPRGVATGGATGAAAPPIFRNEGGNSDVIALVTSSLLKDGPINIFLLLPPWAQPFAKVNNKSLQTCAPHYLVCFNASEGSKSKGVIYDQDVTVPKVFAGKGPDGDVLQGDGVTGCGVAETVVEAVGEVVRMEVIVEILAEDVDFCAGLVPEGRVGGRIPGIEACLIVLWAKAVGCVEVLLAT